VATCPSCGSDNPLDASFCNACGESLKGSAPSREERKIVTCLFCDLVGFTATSESADPEDVNQMLSAYAQMAQTQIESYGGVVEKFIGDAVVGIFGVPAAHEDDPERAVRAGLRIVDEAGELRNIDGAPLRLRVGINTGQMLVRTGVVPGSGERFLAGDAINTASRLQSIAPEMGVGVGEPTYLATSAVFDYEELPPANLKGKAEPVRVFWAKDPLARFGTDLTRTRDSPFVGREIDLALLKGILDKSIAASSPQLVTVVGEPGIGKSRILAELYDHINSRSELITWRQGRCLPYGEGITFWALGEILKAHAGILESDGAELASTKLEHVLPEGTEREWFRQRLLPLLGIEATSSVEREEAFTAWRRFLEQIAEERPTVLVFEDLHWADDAMLEFLEHLADQAEGVSLMILATARPELYEQHPTFAQGLRNLTPISLAPLTEQETARLVGGLLDSTVLPVEVQDPILERSGGNPLYAEEFVRLLKDKELLVGNGASWALAEGAEVPFPDSVQALIAARLDTLPTPRKALLADAAVVGRIFWAGALAHMGTLTNDEVGAELRELSRKELCRAVRRSTMEGEAEYAFWHVLTRDVAYAQIPRAARAAKHVAAATWIESKAPERIEDLAEVLAHHYTTALELARAAGETEIAHKLEDPARRFLTLAGERTFDLDIAQAESFVERALELTPPGHPDHGELLALAAKVATEHGGLIRAEALYRRSIDDAERRGDEGAMAKRMMPLSSIFFDLGNMSEARTTLDRSIGLFERLGLEEELVMGYSNRSFYHAISGRADEAVADADRALELAQKTGVQRGIVNAHNARGIALMNLGDATGVEDFRAIIDLDIGHGAALGYESLAEALWITVGPGPALDAYDESLKLTDRRSLVRTSTWTRAERLRVLFDLGRWDELVGIAREEGAANWLGLAHGSAFADPLEAEVSLRRGHVDRAVTLMDVFLPRVRGMGDLQVLLRALTVAALVESARGHSERAISLLEEVAAQAPQTIAWYLPIVLPDISRVCADAGRAEPGRTLLEGLTPSFARHVNAIVSSRAVLAEAEGELDRAASLYEEASWAWATYGSVLERGLALLGHGRCLLGLPRGAAAVGALREARGVFTSLGARPALEEADTLLEEAIALSS
jgi:class 3 adenylate cyclase/tetratricopeptide (TPR) repeat protein